MDEFKQNLTKAIESYIRRAKRDGTTGMSIDCLKQCVRAPYGGPTGTNARYIYNEIFADTVKQSRLAFSFTKGF